MVPVNRWPVNQAALVWLRQAGAEPDPMAAFLPQLAMWGLENGATVPPPLAPSQPDRNDLELMVGRHLGAGSRPAAGAMRWFLSNQNFSRVEQMNFLLTQLQQAQTPLEASVAALQVAYDRMVAANS